MQSAPFLQPLLAYKADWIISDVTNALTVIRLTRRLWSGHLTASGTNDRSGSEDDILWEDDGEDKDDSDRVTDSDWVMSDVGECDE